MTWKTHVTGGLLLGLATVKALDILDVNIINSSVEVFVGGYGCIVGSIAPDMDLMMYGDKASKEMSGGMFGHRGITHSLFMMILLTAVMMLFIGGINAFTVGIAIGYISHLLLDMMTPTGVPILFPSMKKHRFCTIKTGSKQEDGLLGMLVAVMACLIFI